MTSVAVEKMITKFGATIYFNNSFHGGRHDTSVISTKTFQEERETLAGLFTHSKIRALEVAPVFEE